MGEPGTIIVSLDFELAWGTIDRSNAGAELLSEDGRTERQYLDRLLALCDRLQVPVTFATVGHLHHSSCDGHRTPEHPGGWFDRDPETDVETDPQFYAPDAVNAIREADAGHEIGTHTFSHVLCDSVSREVLDWEFDRIAEVHEANGLDRPTSFVAPRNRLPSLDALRENGVEVVRAPRPTPAETTVGQCANRLRQWAGTSAPPIVEPYVRKGVTVTESTPYPSLTTVMLPNGQREPLAAFRRIPETLRQWWHRRYLLNALETASRTGGTLHLWSHLYNLANEAQWEPIEAVLRAIAEYRDAGDVVVRTMGDLKSERASAERTSRDTVPGRY